MEVAQQVDSQINIAADLVPVGQDLVYLMVGDRTEYDIAEYPNANIRTFKYSGQRQSTSMDAPDARSKL